MPRVIRSTIVDAPTDRVWDVVRDFNGYARWHPAVQTSTIARREPADEVGCVRRLQLADGAEVEEKLLTLSDLEQSCSYCLLETTVPLFNYVAHLRLLPVTDGDRTFWSWEARFTTRRGEEAEMERLIADGIFLAGFAGARRQLGLGD
jgi:hypothetical protein